MNQSTHQRLNAFDALPDGERREVAVAVLLFVDFLFSCAHFVGHVWLRPKAAPVYGVSWMRPPSEMADDALVMATEELFLELDAREAADGKS